MIRILNVIGEMAIRLWGSERYGRDRYFIVIFSLYCVDGCFFVKYLISYVLKILLYLIVCVLGFDRYYNLVF